MIMKQRSRWKVLWCLLATFGSILATEDDNRNRNVQKSLFYPRMDYDQWKPLGRGDPLKNDPTFDYMPPVLDHVHYWMDPEPHPQPSINPGTENGQKTEILLLGVSSKKPATSAGHNQSPAASDRRDTIYEPYHKYHQDKTTNYYNNHHTNNNNQRIARPNYLPSMTSQVIPSLMSLANQVLERTVFSKVPTQDGNRMPYTVLMPPPMLNNNQFSQPLLTSPMTQKPFERFTPQYSSTPRNPAAAAVTVQESNLIYQSSSLGNEKEFESVPSVSWELLSSTESAKKGFMYNENLSPPKSFIRIQFSPQNYSNKILEASDSNHNINYVTPPPLDDSQMTFKGQVSDDNDISDSYVKIEKPQAQMDHMGVEINNVHPIIFTHPEPFRPPNDYSVIRDMETMKPPPVTQTPIYTQPTNPVINVLKKELTTSTTSDIPPLHSLATTEISTTTMTEPLETTTLPTTTTEIITTMQTLTTDPLFKHYKQPIEPMRGPLYLIIQGHSKVKTYKPAKQIDGIMVQETNEIPYKNVDYNIRHLHGYAKNNKEDYIKKADNIAKQRQARTGNLQTLKHVVETGLGAIDFSKNEAELRRRSDVDLEETELQVGYEVANSKTIVKEKYHKGIVEEARKLA